MNSNLLDIDMKSVIAGFYDKGLWRFSIRGGYTRQEVSG